MNEKISQKIKELPQTPGVYLYRNDKARVIYVGKAVKLKNRVSSYFQKREHDPKTTELVKNIANLEWIEVGSEFEALVLEAELIKRYKPKYNIEWKDNKNYAYLKLSGDKYPRVSIVHQVTDHNAKFIGPFIDVVALRSILKLGRKIFPYCTCGLPDNEACLYYHIGLCPGHGEKYISEKDYARNLKGLLSLFNGKTKNLEDQFRKEMNKAAKEHRFEVAAAMRDKIRFLKRLEHTHLFTDLDLESDKGLSGLAQALELEALPRRIECFDISNVMGIAAVGSMVVFKNGIASPRDYRRFQIKTVKGANDFAMMAEVLGRRFKLSTIKKSDSSFAELPDLVILDGGKGQLSAVIKNVQIPSEVKVVSLAKRLEEIFSIANRQGTLSKELEFKLTRLEPESEAMYLVQRIRDEAHRFAVSYHRKVKTREAFETSLDAIIGVGPKTKKKLLQEFGSIKRIKEATLEELSAVVGEKIAHKIKENLGG